MGTRALSEFIRTTGIWDAHAQELERLVSQSVARACLRARCPAPQRGLYRLLPTAT